MILVVFHTAGINEKKNYIYHGKKNNNFSAVGWKSYCNTKMMYCGAGQAGRRPGARPRPRYGLGRAATRRWALRYRWLGGHDTALGAR